MKIIVPMAGRGSRIRPHSLTVPKPLIPVAGEPIVHRLVKDIVKVLKQPIEEIAFVLGDPSWFGDDVVASLKELAKGLGAKASIYRQDQPLGTGHAIMSAEPSLSGPAVIAYADALIRAEFELDPVADSVIWTKKVPNPEAYGVVNLNERGEITELVEKPSTFVSDEAVIGIYYFKDVAVLKVFKTGTVDEWMDCGNKNIAIETNAKMLGFLHNDGEKLIADSVVLENASVIPPCFIGENVTLRNVTLGPHVAVGDGTVIEDSTIKNSLIQSNSHIKNARLDEAMIGNHVKYNGSFTKVSVGDYTILTHKIIRLLQM